MHHHAITAENVNIAESFSDESAVNFVEDEPNLHMHHEIKVVEGVTTAESLLNLVEDEPNLQILCAVKAKELNLSQIKLIRFC